jgi:hypothetical protein
MYASVVALVVQMFSTVLHELRLRTSACFIYITLLLDWGDSLNCNDQQKQMERSVYGEPLWLTPYKEVVMNVMDSEME